MKQNRELKMVRLLEPEMCTNCRFASLAIVRTRHGEEATVIKCGRRDCDNWEIKSAENIEVIENMANQKEPKFKKGDSFHSPTSLDIYKFVGYSPGKPGWIYGESIADPGRYATAFLEEHVEPIGKELKISEVVR